jgi:hypothetical protein
VHTPPPDFCNNDHTPSAPAGVTAARVGSDVCTGAGTSQMTLSWTKVAPPAECTSLYYRGYQCQGLGCTPTTPVNGFFTSDAVNCTGTSCTSNVISVAPSKISNRDFRFAVTAVCEINTCPVDPTTRTWEGPKSSTVGDACP